MNLIYAEVVEIYSEHGARLGKVRVRGALSTVPLHLVTEAQPGDTVLVCDGVAIGRVSDAVNVGQASRLSAGTGGTPVLRCQAEADKNVRAPDAHVPIGKVNEASKQSSIIGGSNVSRCSR
jgi:hydrogenase maturation factor